MTNEKIVELKDLRTCDVADVLQSLGISDGGFLPGIHMVSPQLRAGHTVVAGPAYTVKFCPRDAVNGTNGANGANGINGSNGPTLVTKEHWLDPAPEGSVVVIKQADGEVSAVMGGVISARAHAIGISGIIVDGNVRDIEEHRAIEFPVFSRGHSVLCPATKNIDTCIPIEIEGKTIRPGDYILADSDGVIHFPPEYLDKVLSLVPNILDMENKVRNAVLAGMPVTEAHRQYKPHIYK